MFFVFFEQISRKEQTAKHAMWIDCGIHAREWISPAFCLWFTGYVSVHVLLSCNFLTCGPRPTVSESAGLFIKMHFPRSHLRILDLNSLEVRLGNLQFSQASQMTVMHIKFENHDFELLNHHKDCQPFPSYCSGWG